MLLLSAALVAIVTAPALADDLGLITPDDAVIGHPSMVYGELLKQIIPDLESDGSHWTGHLPDGVRMIDGGEPGETPETVEISSLEVKQLDAGGQKTLWVMADIGEGGNLGTYTLLAVFDASARLLDKAEVDVDRLTGFIGEPLRISRTDDAIMVDSEHSNSDQTYQDMKLVFLHNGKLAVVDDFFAFGVRLCTYQQYEDISAAATPAGAILMSMSLSQWPIRRRAGPWMYACVAIFGLATIVFGLSRNVWLSIAALAVLGAADMVSVFVRQTLVQIVTPDHMRGRVSSASFLFIGASNQLGEFESGTVARFLGPVGAALFGGFGSLLVTLVWIKLFPVLFKADRLE